MQYQRNRMYNLIVKQDAGFQLEINTLHIEFTVTKYADNKKKPNKARVSIYNLPADFQRHVEAPFVECVLQVGYLGIGTQQLFAGQVTLAKTEKRGADVVTTLELDSLYTTLNHKKVTKTVAPGRTIQEVIMSLTADTPEITKSVFSGEGIKAKVVDGYPLMGSPRQILTELAQAYSFEWQIDDKTLYINDIEGSYTNNLKTCYVVAEGTGLIERPYHETIEKGRGKKDKRKRGRKGVQLTMLLNPAITAGSIIKIEYEGFTDFYKVEAITSKGSYEGDDWTSELKCSTLADKKKAK